MGGSISAGSDRHDWIILTNSESNSARRKSVGLLTVKQFAAEVGLTPRTVRTYHSRGLLTEPIRVGRTPYYSTAHLARVREVLDLQSRGLPLEAVRALLEPDLVLGQFHPLARAIESMVGARPAYADELVARGVLVRAFDGGLRVSSVRAAVAALTAYGPGASPGAALRLLADALAEVLPHAEAALEEVRRTVRERVPRERLSDADLPELVVEIVRMSITGGGGGRRPVVAIGSNPIVKPPRAL